MIKQTGIVFIMLIAFSCSTSPADLTKRYAATYNTHNVKRIVSLYADDAVFEAVGQYRLSGKNQMRDHTEYYSVLNAHMDISDIETKGDTVSCIVSLTNDWLKVSGIDKVHYAADIVFEDRLIKYIRAEATSETQKAFNQVLSPLMEWAKVNKADLLKEMMPEGKPVYNADNAGKALSLLHLWKDSLK